MGLFNCLISYNDGSRIGVAGSGEISLRVTFRNYIGVHFPPLKATGSRVYWVEYELIMATLIVLQGIFHNGCQFLILYLVRVGCSLVVNNVVILIVRVFVFLYT